MKKNVAAGAELFTDAHAAYQGLNAEYVHQVIDNAEAYAEGNVHTNGLENFWSLLKRSLSGTYISVEPFHLFRYLDEQAFRYNNRKMSDSDRFKMTVGNIAGRRLTYNEVRGKSREETL